LIVGRALDL